MGWFNVLKGSYPSLQQIDKTLDVAVGQTNIVRGSLIKQVGTTFVLAGAADSTDATAFLYFALQGQNDLVAGMAGSIGQGVQGGVARITGLAVGNLMEVETSVYDTAEAPYAAGAMLTVGADGKVTAHPGTEANCIGQVTKADGTRYVNDATFVTGWSTGANVSVLTFRCMWIPNLVTV